MNWMAQLTLYFIFWTITLWNLCFANRLLQFLLCVLRGDKEWQLVFCALLKQLLWIKNFHYARLFWTSVGVCIPYSVLILFSGGARGRRRSRCSAHALPLCLIVCIEGST